jgi:hypothetical protein
MTDPAECRIRPIARSIDPTLATCHALTIAGTTYAGINRPG